MTCSFSKPTAFTRLDAPSPPLGHQLRLHRSPPARSMPSPKPKSRLLSRWVITPSLSLASSISALAIACHALPARSGTLPTSLLLDTYLAVMETKGIRCDFESGFNELLVYLAMVHRARARKLRRDHITGNSTVYGVLSDGDRFVFLCLDNDSMVSQFDPPSQPESIALTWPQVYRSLEFNIVTHLPQILL